MRPFILTCLLIAAQAGWADCPPSLDWQPRLLHSNDQFDLCQLTGKRAILVVNTASQCGYTPQFRQLEALYQRYRAAGLVIVGFPSDDFRQEYRDESKTADVCFVNYGVSFPMLATGPVTGDRANPLFRALAAQLGAPDWNFNKYLLSGDGRPLARWRAAASPLGGELEAAIREALTP